MATPAEQLDQMLTSTFAHHRPGIADQFTTRTSILAALETNGKVEVDGGESIKQALLFEGNDTVEFYEDYDLFDTTPQDGLAHAIYDWKNLNGTVVISGPEIRKNSGREQFIDLVDTKFKQLEKSLLKQISDAFWATAPASNAFLSIPVIVGNTGVLGGVDSATETWWQSVVKAGPADLTTNAGVKVLNNLYNSLWIEGSSPDFEFTTQANFEAYEQLAVPQIRFQQTKMMDLGFEVIAHKTAEVVMEPGVPAPGGSDGGFWYMLNIKDHLEFVQHRGTWLKKLDTQRPYNQDAYVTPVISMGNLVTDERRAHGVITQVTVA